MAGGIRKPVVRSFHVTLMVPPDLDAHKYLEGLLAHTSRKETEALIESRVRKCHAIPCSRGLVHCGQDPAGHVCYEATD